MPRQGRNWLLNGLIRCPKDGLRMQGRGERWGPIYRCGLPFTGCYFYANLDVLDVLVLRAVGGLLTPLTGSFGVRAQLWMAWARLQAPKSNGDERRVRSLEQAVEKARRRRNTAMDLLVDGTIDRAEYDASVGRYTAEIVVAERELAEIGTAAAVPPLPALADMVRDAGSWGAILEGADITAQREILAVLVERITPERVGRGQYSAKIEWTPLGAALEQLHYIIAAA